MPAAIMRHHPPPLTRTLLGFCVAIVLVVAIFVLLPLRGGLGDYEAGLQEKSLDRGSRALQLTVSRVLEREWDSLGAVARELDPTASSGTRNFVDAAARASEAIVWAGYAAPWGIIQAGSARQREGEDVSDEEWFLQGRQAGRVGSAHAPRSTEIDGGASRLISLAAPVEDDELDGSGVLTYSIGLDWLSDLMSQSAEDLGIDFAVVDGGGRIILSHTTALTGPMPGNIGNLAALGEPLSRRVEGSDGSEQLLKVYPDFLVGDLPDFGWRLVVRTAAAPGQSGLRSFVASLGWSVTGFLVLLAVAVIAYSRFYLHPLERLAREADRIAGGEEFYPSESSSSRESLTLSSALARIQSRLDSGSPGPGE